jgi:hypothetical protein
MTPHCRHGLPLVVCGTCASSDPLRPPETDEEPWQLTPYEDTRDAVRDFLLALIACGVILGIVRAVAR